MQKPSIIVKDLVVKTQDNSVLDGISFSLRSTEHLAIFGNSGSGKTALAKALAGRIHYNGKVSFDSGSEKTRVEMVEQRYSFKNLCGISEFYYQQRFNSFDSEDAPTVYEELVKASSKDSKQGNNIDNTLAILGIEQLKNSPLIQLSSGEHKRFQLAKALVNPPQVLLLDTPYTGLDVASVQELNQILDAISKKGTQIILIPGTFPVPDFITSIAFLENKKLSFFGNKENYHADEFNHADENFIYNADLLPDSSETTQFGSIVEMKNIHLNYGAHTIFTGLSWEINEGEKWLLKGRNGSGKSSLLSMITGDHPQAYSNEIYLFGKRRGSGESIWDIKQKTGFISPELHAYFDKNVTCFQAIGSGFFDTIGLFKKLSTAQYNTILQWLDFLRVSHVSTKPLHSISASLQRMILLARALVKNPPLLVLDEPCQGLDQKQSTQFVSLVDSICSGTNKTLIYVSHDERNVPECIEKVFQLEKKGDQYYSIIEPATLAVA
ncbi:MAG: ATP-binding cassette domain-containing protein [Bacteroidota bacterium]|nr:ATP-binding cassette domain-containing protein [Bacteroidota bacterium]